MLDGNAAGASYAPVCFSADATVRIQESPTPVTMRELKTGQHVECLDSGADMLAPTTTRYCEVMAWVGERKEELCVCVCVCVHVVYITSATGSAALVFERDILPSESHCIQPGAY